MRHWAATPWVVIPALALLVLLTQTGAITDEVIDWDESTFVLLAGRLLDGHLPYVDLLDNKPPLIFFLLAGAMAVFGESLWTVRLFGDACVLAIAVLTVAILRRFVTPVPALLCGALSVAIFALPPGQHTGSELPATAFILGAALLLLRWPGGVWAIAGAGALMSLATLTRSNLALVAVAIGVTLTIAGVLLPRSPIRPWAILPFTAAGLVPLALFLLLYWQAGALDAFVLSTVTVPLNYAGSQATMAQVFGALLSDWGDLIRAVPLWAGGFTAVVVVGAVSGTFKYLTPPTNPRTDHTPGSGAKVALLSIFAASVSLSVLGSGGAYPHYLLQILPFAVMAVAPGLNWSKRRIWANWSVAVVMAATLFAALAQTTPGLWRLTDGGISDSWTVRQAATKIAADVAPGDQVWAVRNHLILWYLNMPPVSPLAAHPSNVARTSILQPLVDAGYIEADVLQRIYDNRPRFVVSDSPTAPPYLANGPVDFRAFLHEHYDVFFEARDVVVYRLTAAQDG